MKTMSFFVLFGMLAAVAIVPEGCTVGKTFTKTPPPEVSPEARVLYEKTFSKEGMPTSDVVVTVSRTSPDTAIIEFILNGKLSYISASVLLPEDVEIAHSKVEFRYLAGQTWYEKFRESPPKLEKLFSEELSPLSLPKQIPFGIGSGYRFMGKLLEGTVEEQDLNDYLQNNFDSVDIAFLEKKGVDAFSVRIPIGKLNPMKTYEVWLIAQYSDGETRMLQDQFFFRPNHVPLE
jgi:hypothetical protein